MASTPQEAVNNLLSNSYLRITDLLGEGQMSRFVPLTGQYGSDPLCSTFFDNVPVRNPDGSYNFNVSGQGFGFFFTMGTTGQLPIPGFEYVENVIPLSSNTEITKPPVGAGVSKSVVATFNTNTYPDADSIKVTIQVPAMYTVGSDGSVNGFNFSYAVDISLNNGPFVNIDDVTIQGKCTNPYFNTQTYQLPKTTPPQPFYQWTVRISKTTDDVLSTTTIDSVFIQSIGVISSSQFNYPNSAIASILIDAEQFAAIPTRTYLMDGILMAVPNGYTPTQYVPGTFMARGVGFDLADGRNIGMFPDTSPASLAGVYAGMSVTCPAFPAGTTVTHVTATDPANFSVSQDPTMAYTGLVSFYNPSQVGWTAIPAVYPTVWDGTFQSGVWTDNPAWIFYDLLTNPRYGLGDYITPDQIDKWTLYQIAQYCDDMVDNGQGVGVNEPRFTCNVSIDLPDAAYNVLLNLSSVFRGMVYYANGVLTATQVNDKTPVFDYTNANVIKGQFSYADSARNTRSTVANVRWNDPNNFYRQNTAYVEDTDGILRYGYVPKDVSAYACSSPGQATRLGQWLLLTERLLTETISFQVGMDGLYVKPGDVFNVYDNFRNNQNQGGRVLSYDAARTTLTLDRPVNIQPGYNYVLSAVIPKAVLSPTELTGSNQIPLLRTSQIETWAVTNAPASGLSALTVNTAFSSGLYKGSPWILSVSGGGTIFNNASIYQCLSTAEVQPGIMSVVALQYNTGLMALVNQKYGIVPNPVNSGDNTAISPPSNLVITSMVGTFQGNQPFTYEQLTWTPTPSTNVASYVVSGQDYMGSWFQLGMTAATGCVYYPGNTGQANFLVAAVSKGGVYSTFISGNVVIQPVPTMDPNQFRVWELPDGFGDLEQLGVFYNRPSPTVTSTRVFFATGSGTPYREVLDTAFYPVFGTSVSGLSSTGNYVCLRTTSFDIPTTLTGQSAIDQGNNVLLILVENELMSVGSVTGLGANQYLLNVNRGILGTFGVSHASNLTGIVFFNSELESFSDPSLVNVFNSAGVYNSGIATRYLQIENDTPQLTSVISPANGYAYILPNPTPSAPTSLAATLPGGPIVHLTWTGPQNTDIEQYQVYRATSPFTGFGAIAATTNTFYDDVNVLLGNTYQYYVQTEATNTQQSTASNTITVMPTGFLPSGISLAPPSNPSAATLTNSGNYLSADGSLLAFLTFSVPGGNVGDAYTTLQYSRTGTPLVGMTIAGQTTGTTPQALTIYDLSPNVGYNVATQAQSSFGFFSSGIVLANGAPFVAPAFNNVTNSPGGPPSAPTNVQISGGLGNTANFVAVTWSANQQLNVEEYGIYRNTINSQPGSPIAFASTTQYVDATVVGGSTYFYWVSTFNRSEQQSSAQASSPTNITVQGAPAAAGTPVLSSSGFHYAVDGTVLNDFTFTVPALPAYAFGQQLLYGRNNNTAQMMVGGDVENANSSTGVTLNDLAPGGSGYYVALKPYSQHGVPGGITFANGGNPITGAGRTTAVNPPSNVHLGATTTNNSVLIPPVYIPGVLPSAGIPLAPLMPTMTGTWTASSDNDIVFYEYAFANSAPFNITPVNYQSTVPATQLYAIGVYIGGSPLSMWVRAINKSQTSSTWQQSSNASFGASTYAGNLGVQNANATNVSQIQVSDPSLTSSPTKSAVIQQIVVNPATVNTNGATVSAVNYSVSMVGLGFNTIPEVGIINLDGGQHGAQYRYNMSNAIVQSVPITGVYISIYRFDGTADITDGENFLLNCYFQENF